jgi:hypothetical protein
MRRARPLCFAFACAALAAVGSCDTAHSQRSVRPSATAHLACVSSNLSVAADGAYRDEAPSGVGVWLRLHARSGEGCVFKSRPSVIINSGLAHSAIDGTAEADSSVRPGMLVDAEEGLRLLVSWTKDCEPNHKAPIESFRIGPEGDERLEISGKRLPAQLEAIYCWNNGVGLGTSVRLT